MLLTAQRHYQVADYALQGLACSPGASGTKPEVGTALRALCSALHKHRRMVSTSALRMLPCPVSAMLACDSRLMIDALPASLQLMLLQTHTVFWIGALFLAKPTVQVEKRA